MKKLISLFVLLALVSAGAIAARGELRLPSLLSDGMVLQRNSNVRIWGEASPGARIAIKASWSKKKFSARADTAGHWQIQLPTSDAGGPHTISISGDGNSIALRDILLGEVWVCGGQSNMEMPLDGYFGQPVLGSEEAKRRALRYTGLRLYTVGRNAAETAQTDCAGSWKSANARNAGDFSAAGWFFATALSDWLGVPVGMICTAWSGTEIERWMQPGTVDALDINHGFQDRWRRHNGELWNGMVAPLTPFAVKGFIWYQGEANEGNWMDYSTFLPEMVRQWRSAWGEGDIPFYIAQIAPYGRDGSHYRLFPLLAEQQYKALAHIPNSAIAPTNDIGSEKLPHPSDKKSVGERFAALALANTYGLEGVAAAAVPHFESMEVQDGSAVLRFAASGQWSFSSTGADGSSIEPEGFEIAGPDSVFVPAFAKIEYVTGPEGLWTGNCIKVWADGVSEPKAVRYAFHNFCENNVHTTAGIPLPPFRTDDWRIPPEEISTVSMIAPSELRCEYLAAPVIDVRNPRLSWVNSPINPKVKGESQSAYQIMVASTQRGLSRNEADVWDSGKVASGESHLVEYSGPALQPGRDYWWKVRVWDAEGRVSAWSEPGRWTTGLLEASQWKAKWIGAPWQEDKCNPADHSVPLFRRAFKASGEVVSAKAFVTGLGFFEFCVNGQKACKDVYLTPPFTDYGRREGMDGWFIPIVESPAAYRVMYDVYDLTALLKTGENEFTALVANGYFNSDQEKPKKRLQTYNRTASYGSPRFICQIEIEYADGRCETLVTDENWQVSHSPVVYSDLFGGEVYDAGFDSYDWQPAVLREAPEGKLVAATVPHDVLLETLRPVSLEKLPDGSWKADFGKIVSGWLRLGGVRGKRGDTLSVFYPNEIPGRGFKYIYEQAKNGDSKYVFKDEAAVNYAPKFTWYAFREAIISGVEDLSADNIVAEVIGTDIRVNSEFHCSDTLLEQINTIWRQAQINNMHACVSTDCPDRERIPYLGDGQVAMKTVLYNFDAAGFYNKWIADVRASRDTVSGYVPNSAPVEPRAGGGVGFGAAIDVMPWEFYLRYGDRSILEENFDAMKAYVRYLEGWRAPDGTVLVDRLFWLSLGDWAASVGYADKALVHSFFLWYCADIAAKAAAVLGRPDEEAPLRKLADDTAAAFHKRFYDRKAKSYGDFGSNVFALMMDMPAARRADVVKTLRDEIMVKYNGHLNTGLFSTRFLLEVLAENGLNDVAFTVMNQRDIPSFGWWLEQGATTFWEYFNGDWSHNHPMYGGCLVWLYNCLAGVNPEASAPGFRHFTVKPVSAKGLDWVSYATQTPYGRLSSRVEWNADGSASLEVTVPVGCSATVYQPLADGSVRTVELNQGTYRL